MLDEQWQWCILYAQALVSSALVTQWWFLFFNPSSSIIPWARYVNRHTMYWFLSFFFKLYFDLPFEVETFWSFMLDLSLFFLCVKLCMYKDCLKYSLLKIHSYRVFNNIRCMKYTLRIPGPWLLKTFDNFSPNLLSSKMFFCISLVKSNLYSSSWIIKIRVLVNLTSLWERNWVFILLSAGQCTFIKDKIIILHFKSH